MSMIFFPYSTRSMGCRRLAKALGASVFGRDPVNITKQDVAVCWGQFGENLAAMVARVVNPRTAVQKVSDKAKFFSNMAGKINLPEWTKSSAEAIEWVKAGHTVLGRRLTNSSGGKGILFYDQAELADFLSCKMFVKYIKNMGEYRAHFAFGKIIDWQKKGLRKDVDLDKIDKRVRSHKNGYIFLRQDLVIPAAVKEQAELCVKAVPVDFGALDIIYNQYYDKAYVLECNTAPGIEGTTVDVYEKAFRKELME